MFPLGGAARDPLPAMARVRLGGYDPLLRPEHARCGAGQGEAADEHRRRHGLAVRKQEGAQRMITRRDLLRGVAGTVGLLGWPPGHASGEPPPETTKLKIAHFPSICVAPQYIVTELLKAEGYTVVTL